MMRVNLINDIVQIIEDHLIEGLVYQTSIREEKKEDFQKYFFKISNNTLSSLSIILYRICRLIVSDRHICCKHENNSF